MPHGTRLFPQTPRPAHNTVMEDNMVKPAFGVQLEAPYFTKDKWVAPYFFTPEIQAEITPPAKVRIHDVTLRDGEQAPRIAFPPAEKIFIAQALDRLGVHSIEPGLTATAEDREVIKTLTGMGLKSKIVPLCRVKEEDVKACLDLHPDGALVEIAINPFLLRDVYNKSPEKLIDEVVEYSTEFRKQGMYVEFMGWDAFRIPDFGYLERFFSTLAQKAPLDRITVADTFGMSHPFAMFKFIRKMRAWTGLPIGLHIHNDFGMATALSVMAISAGADEIHSAINGIGERAGNVATEEVAFALQHLYNIDAGIDLSQIANVSEIVAETSKVLRSRNKPLVGSGLFEVGIGHHCPRDRQSEEFRNRPVWVLPLPAGHCRPRRIRRNCGARHGQAFGGALPRGARTRCRSGHHRPNRGPYQRCRAGLEERAAQDHARPDHRGRGWTR